jgi:hypothetical protein
MGMDRITLLDIARQTDPDGSIAQIVEVLDQYNPILQDAPAMPGNAPMGNRVTRRSSLPSVAWGKINEGVTRTKGSVGQVLDTIGMLVALSEVDARIEKIHGSDKLNRVRWGEDKAFLEAAAQEVASTFLYGNELSSESSFTGLQPRLTTLATAITGSQVRSHHASPSGSDYTSIYVIDWGEDYCHVIYPEASQAGIDSEDLGKQRVNDKDGNPFMAFCTEYTWMIGLTVKDPRRIARLCNIDVSQALADTTTLLTDSLIKLVNGMPPKSGANRVLYCSRNILSALELQIQSKSNVLFSWGEYLGEKTLHFKGSPFRFLDQMSEAESQVT